MPGIFDRYVLASFCSVLAITFCSLTGLYIVLHAFTNFDELLNYTSREGLWPVIGQFYGPRALEFFDHTGAMMALLAAIVTVSTLSRNNELTAISAAGVSKGRIVSPLIWAAVVVGMIGVANREIGIPWVRQNLLKNVHDLRGGQAKPLRPTYDYRTDIFIGGRRTVASQRKIMEPHFRLPPTLAQQADLGHQILAATAVYQNRQPDRPAGYLLDGVTTPANIATTPSASLAGAPVILTPRDHSWLGPAQCFIVTDVTFEQLASGSYFRRLSSSRELIAALKNPSLELGSDARVMIHARLVQPVLDLVLFLLGMPLVLSRQQRNVFVAAGMCVALVTVFFVVVMSCHVLGSSRLVSPVFGAWLPLLIFAPPAYVFAVPLWK